MPIIFLPKEEKYTESARAVSKEDSNGTCSVLR
jgi:hypothetical protein